AMLAKQQIHGLAYVDYAVMEKTADAVVVGLDADWSDVGSWSALWEVSPKDEQGNVLSGDAWVHNSENCYINSDEKLVAAIGVTIYKYDDNFMSV
ncbi:hypothetical protein FK514_29675, partial [Klebsiella pneumoniae]|uniref:sugar phosphate nucleotidyltransferase n=1 Tax=Klebsiella pneumoniae TaxID=573 RepID=UPI00210B975C